MQLKDLNRFTKVLMPNLKIDPAVINGSINSEKKLLTINAVFPQINYQNLVLKNVNTSLTSGSKLVFKNKIADFALGENYKINNLALLTESADNAMNSKLSWNNYDDVSYSGSIQARTVFSKGKNYPHLENGLLPGRIYVADELWKIEPASLSVDSSKIQINKLRISSKGQSVMADGLIDKTKDNKLNISFNKIDLNTLNSFLKNNFSLKGELNGSISLFDVYTRLLFLADLKVDDLALLGQPMGDAAIQTRWDADSQEIVAEMTVKSDEKTNLHAYGTYDPERDSLSIDTHWDQFSLLILQPLMGSDFSNFHGNATGKVRITGPLGHIRHNGALYADKAGLMLSDLKVNYNLSDSVRFEDDKIIFPNIRIRDNYTNSGVFSGTIQHRSV